MAKVKPSERLRAPLMYAFRTAAAEGDAKKRMDLRDEGGERVIAVRRATGSRQRSLSDTALRDLLAQDLDNLLNTINLESSSPELLDGLDHVRKSILNYGMNDLSDKTIDETAKLAAIRDEIETVLRSYEPRLIARSLRVVRDQDHEEELSIRFIVTSDMRADPVPTPIEFITEVELDTGDVKVGRL